MQKKIKILIAEDESHQFAFYGPDHALLKQELGVVITVKDEENFRLSSPEMFAAYGSLANFADDQRSQSWQGEMSSARHFYREAAEWYEKTYSAKPFIELSKVERLAGLTAYAERLHRQGSTRAFTRLAHIAQL